MQKVSTKNTGDTYLVDEFNNTVSQESQNVVSNTAQAFNPADNTQLAQGIVRIGASIVIYLDTGVANNYVLSPISLFVTITKYMEGMTVWFRAKATNIGSSTANVNSMGQIPIVNNDGSQLTGGEIIIDVTTELIYLNGQFILVQENAVDATLRANLADQTPASEGSRLVGITGTTLYNGLVRAFGFVSEAAGVYVLQNSYNVASILKNGVGDVAINFTDNMTTALYVVKVSTLGTGASTIVSPSADNLAVGTFNVKLSSGSLSNPGSKEASFSFVVEEFR